MAVWIVIGLVALGTPGLGAPAPEPRTVGDVLARCRSDEGFCRIRILAAAEVLEREGRLCPRTTPKEAIAFQVAETIEHVVEADAESFKDIDYGTLVEQLLLFLWPCDTVE